MCSRELVRTHFPRCASVLRTSRASDAKNVNVDNILMTKVTTRGGTLVLCFLTKSAAYLSADSRYTNSSRSDRDTARKAFLCGGDSICGVSGYPLIRLDPPGRRPVVIDVLRTAAKIGQRRGIQIERLAEGIGYEILNTWRQFDGTFSAPIPEDRDPSIGASLCSILYVGRSRRYDWLAKTIRFPFRQRQLGYRKYSIMFDEPRIISTFEGDIRQDTPKVIRQGRLDCLSAMHEGDFGSDGSVMRLIDQLYADAERSGKSCADEIGGPIDIAKLTRSECSWLRRKP